MSSIYKIYAAKKLKRRKWRRKKYYRMTRQDSEEEWVLWTKYMLQITLLINRQISKKGRSMMAVFT